MRSHRRDEDLGVSLLDLAVLVATVSLVAAFQVPSYLRCRTASNRTICARNLKQIALAAMQYSDDKRFFPHIAKITELDGDHATATSARCLRSLVFFGYLDNPEDFVCPSSADETALLTTAQKQDLRRWSWRADRDVADPSVSPIVSADASDLPLSDRDMTTLSYGWTRRGYTSNGCCQLLAADKSRRQDGDGLLGPARTGAHVGPLAGNHGDCMVAVAADGHTTRIAPEGDVLTTGRVSPSISGTENPGDGYLGVLADE